MRHNPKTRNNLLPDDRIALSIMTLSNVKSISNIRQIKEQYNKLRREVVCGIDTVNFKDVDEFIIKCLVDALPAGPSEKLKEHILNKG